MDEITRKMRKANAQSADPDDRMGVWPFSYKETDPGFKAAQRQHDLECVMHDAGLTDESVTEANDNFCKNLFFASEGNALKWGKAAALCGIATIATWIFW